MKLLKKRVTTFNALLFPITTIAFKMQKRYKRNLTHFQRSLKYQFLKVYVSKNKQNKKIPSSGYRNISSAILILLL